LFADFVYPTFAFTSKLIIRGEWAKFLDYRGL
jgi:hypothetical protein